MVVVAVELEHFGDANQALTSAKTTIECRRSNVLRCARIDDDDDVVDEVRVPYAVFQEESEVTIWNVLSALSSPISFHCRNNSNSKC